MAPRSAKKQHATRAGGASPLKTNTRIAELCEFARQVAVVQVIYVALRTAWHVWVPRKLGAEPFVPHMVETLVAASGLFLLFSAAGGFDARQGQGLLTAYHLLSVPLLCKCGTDAIVATFLPHTWKHYTPGAPWGVPALLAARVPREWLFGVDPDLVLHSFKILELSLDAICILYCFRGLRGGKALLLARKEQGS